MNPPAISAQAVFSGNARRMTLSGRPPPEQPILSDNELRLQWVDCIGPYRPLKPSCLLVTALIFGGENPSILAFKGFGAECKMWDEPRD